MQTKKEKKIQLREEFLKQTEKKKTRQMTILKAKIQLSQKFLKSIKSQQDENKTFLKQRNKEFTNSRNI